MTDRAARTGTAARVLVTGASVAAGLGLVGAFGAAAAVPSDATGLPAGQAVQVVRRVVVVPSTQPDIVLRAAGSSGATVVLPEVPAPIIRVRPAPTIQASAPAPTAPVQTTSSGS